MPKQANVAIEKEQKFLLRIVSTTYHAKRDTLLILMSYKLGLRAIELSALKISDVLTPGGDVIEHVKLKRTKGDEPRDTFLEHKEVRQALSDYIEYRKEYCAKKRITFSHNQPLFLSQKGGAFTNKTMQKCFERIYRLAGFKGFSSHSGRRSFATALDEASISIKTIQVLMGHRSLAMTAKYIDTNPAKLRRALLKA